MSIIIRLQNLPWSASSVDIRKFFQGLSIPDGGVHIVGGEKGDAFIAFASDEDARQAMARNDGVIRDAKIKLFLSSRNEMQRVIDQARNGIAASDPDGAPKIAPDPLAKRIAQITPQTVAPALRNAALVPPQTTGDRSRARSRSPVNRQAANGTAHDTVQQTRQPPVHVMQVAPMSGLVPMPALSVQMTGGQRRVTYGEEAVPLNIELQRQVGALGPPEGVQWTRRVQDFSTGRPLDEMSRQLDNAYPAPVSLPDPRTGLIQRNAADLQNRDFDLNGRRIVPLQAALNPPPFSGRLELRGLPFNVTPRDIQDFFRIGVGMFVPDDRIKILVDDRGMTTGGATVRVANESDLRSALELNGRLMGDRRIDVMPLLDDINTNDLSQLSSHRPVVSVPPAPIIVPQPLPTQSIPQVQQQLPPPSQQQQPQQQSVLPQRDYVIYMKGIPFNACTDRDVSNFFQGLRLTEIVFEMDRHTGKPAGNAFVELPTREDYEGALELNLRHMGRRYIEVFPTTRDDMEEARRIANGGTVEKPTHCVNVTGLPPTITNNDLTSYFKDVGAVPYAIHIMLKPNGLNAGEAYLEFSSPEHQAIAATRDGDVISNCRISVQEVPFHVMRKIVGRPPGPPAVAAGPRNDFRPNFDERRSFGPNRDRFDDRRGGRAGGRGGSQVSSNRRRDPFADARCVVHASNVPYKATNEDLKNFFGEFDTVEGGIERRINERGLATPEARIAFRSTQDAERAVKAMHKKFIQGRPVFLRLAV